MPGWYTPGMGGQGKDAGALAAFLLLAIVVAIVLIVLALLGVI